MLEIKKSIEQGFGKGGLYDILKQLQNMACLTEGKVFYVAKNGNNTDGLSWKTAFKTIAAAITASNATVSWSGNTENNYIIIAPGNYPETIASSIYYANLIGLGNSGESKAVITSAAGIALAGNMIGSRLCNIRFLGKGSGDICDFGTFNDSIIENCQFVPDAGTLVAAISFDNCKESIIRNNLITSGQKGVKKCDYGMQFHGGDDQYCHNTIIEDNIIIDALEDTGTGIYIEATSNSQGAVIRRNIIRISGAGTGINDDGAGGYQYAVVYDNYVFTVSGTEYNINEATAAMNISNDNGTVTTHPTTSFTSGN